MGVDIGRTIRRLVGRFVENHLEFVFKIYPPYLGAGIRVEHISDDFRHIKVRMPLSFYNQNYVGTQFGGSLYSMCDPFYMLMLTRNLGPGYVVWDKAGEIRFRKPGEGTVYATFEIDQDDIDQIRRTVDEEERAEPVFKAEVVDGAGEVVAEVVKTLHVRREG